MQAIRTGTIEVKRRYVEAKGSNRLMRLTNVLLDDEFVSIPVYMWVIEHPEGVIVVDTGETARVNDPDFFPWIQRPYWKSQYRFNITPEEEAGAQLRQMGIPPEEVRWVILTHTHFDHSDGLGAFRNAEFLISRKERDDIYRYRSAHFGFPAKWPDWFKPRVIDYHSSQVGAFDAYYPVTKAEDVLIIPTPGHTLGHQSVIVGHDGIEFFFGGDTSFDLASLLDGTIDAPAFNADKVHETRQRILDYATQTPLVYLTTHDPETPQRLAQRIPIQPVEVDYVYG